MTEAQAHAHTIEEAQTWTGFKIDDVGGSRAGFVEGVFADSEHPHPVWLIFRAGRIGRRSALPFEFAVAGAARIWVPFAKDLLKRAPEVDPAAGLSPEREALLCEHYGIAEGTRRLAELEGRDAGTVSAVPVG